MAVVYVHKRKDNNQIFYIGIGRNAVRSNSKSSRNKHWHNVVNKYGYIAEITHSRITWEEACSIEKYLISFYKDMYGDKICNLNKGGNGNFGFKFSRDSKKKISESGKISQNKPDVRKKKIEGIKKYYSSTKARELNRQRQILAYSSEEAREKNRIRQNKPEVIQKKREAAAIRFANIEYKLQLGKNQKIAQNRPEVQEKRIKSLKISQNRPEVKNKKIESLKKYYRIKKLKMNNPKVVGICCTYGRFKCVERVVNMFLSQDYKGQKELLIYNTDTDIPYIDYNFKLLALGIHIINNSKDFITGEPYTNVGAIRRDALTFVTDEFCYIFHADDDDIYLPHYISQGVERMKETKLPFFKPMESFFYCGDNLRLVKNTMEASVICDINKIREYGYNLNTALEGLSWYTKARDMRELDEADSYFIPPYCFNWNDGQEMDAPHKQSGNPNDYNNFNNHKAASLDAVNGRELSIYTEQKIREIYKPYFDYIKDNLADFPSELVEKYFTRHQVL